MTHKDTSNGIIQRMMTKASHDPYASCKWVPQTLIHEGQEISFTVPDFWYRPAVEALATIAQGETDLRQVIDRIVNVITKVGFERGYFLTEAEADIFYAELRYLLLHQHITFPSDIWRTLSALEQVTLDSAKQRRVQPVNDLFMRAVEGDGEWRSQEEPKRNGKARDIWQDIVREIWKYGDTTLQFTSIRDDLAVIKSSQETIVPKADIHAARYVQKDGHINVEALKHTVLVTYTALDIMTQCLPVKDPEQLEALRYQRPVSIGLTDIASVLLASGAAYDSDEGREIVRSLFALVNGQALLGSIHFAGVLGAFVGYERHKLAVGRVLRAQRDAIVAHQSHELSVAAKEVWARVVKQYREVGLRNIQIGGLHDDDFMQAIIASEHPHLMPFQTLVQNVEIPSGGKVCVVKEQVLHLLKTRGYTQEQITSITNAAHDHPLAIEKSSTLSEDDRGILRLGSKYVEPQTFEMIATITPFVGLDSDVTLLLPKSVTPRDIEKMLVTAWQLGLPQIRLRREGVQKRSRETAGLSHQKKDKAKELKSSALEEKPILKTHQTLPKIRTSKTFAFCIDTTQCHLTVSEGESGAPLELLINIHQGHAQLTAVLNAWAQSVTIGLQHGISLASYVKAGLDTQFVPMGKTDDEEIPFAHSILDYITRRLALHYLTHDQRESIGLNPLTVDVHKDQVRLIG